MTQIKFLLSIVAVFIFISVSSGQHFLKTSGKSIVNENNDPVLLRGMGLGGWMVQEGYMLQTASFANSQNKIRTEIENIIGKDDTKAFYDAWLTNHVQKSDIDKLKEWGFNSVRLPMHYNLYTLPIEDEPVKGQDTWLDKGFELTDNLIEWCKANEMYVILDMHATPGGQGYDEGISDYDPSKPSLWESAENRRKLVALWTRLADRYKDEQWVAGYDLINEPNWDLPGGTLLREIYEDIIEGVRTVDSKHMIFIEGNWFANDFTGLTPPFDDNFVYSPHKYWSTNDQATMQWVLDLREQYNVPLYLGESGENSNVWFRDAIRLFEDLDIGWAWWPMKKVESVAGPYAVEKTASYQALLDYWEGNATLPSVASARITLMQLAEDFKTENCRFQKDVIDAMFRQVYSDETLPFTENNIPGTIFASDYDMGVVGEAYYDQEVANYQVSTGSFSAWNSGWTYRNDGVDIEKCQDVINTNGYNVGFMDSGEWMQYQVNIAETAVYDIRVRVASGASGGGFHFSLDGSDITESVQTSGTGDWQNWETVTVNDVILDEGTHKLRWHTDQSGFNLSSFEFAQKSTNPANIDCEFVSAETIDPESIRMSVNKSLADLPSSPAGFSVSLNGNNAPITNVNLDPNNARLLIFDIGEVMKSTQDIRITYNGNDVVAADGSKLKTFSMNPVRNTLTTEHQIPGKIEAEDFSFQSGVQLETANDTGGGQNIGYLDVGDYLDYDIEITQSGSYKVDYRTAAEWGTGGLELQLLDLDGNVTTVDNASFANTGNWQSWATTSSNVQLPAGRYTMRVRITEAPFNMNWMDFSLSTSIDENELLTSLELFPNPTIDWINIKANLKISDIIAMDLFNVTGQLIMTKSFDKSLEINERVSLQGLVPGIYFVKLKNQDGVVSISKVVKE